MVDPHIGFLGWFGLKRTIQKSSPTNVYRHMKLTHDFLIGLLDCYVLKITIWKPYRGHLLPPCFPEIFTNFSCEKPAFQLIDFTRKTGAGEGIRTLDPDLGKIHAGSIKIYSLNVHAVHTTPYNLLIYFNCHSQPSLERYGAFQWETKYWRECWRTKKGTEC